MRWVGLALASALLGISGTSQAGSFVVLCRGPLKVDLTEDHRPGMNGGPSWVDRWVKIRFQRPGSPGALGRNLKAGECGYPSGKAISYNTSVMSYRLSPQERWTRSYHLPSGRVSFHIYPSSNNSPKFESLPYSKGMWAITVVTYGQLKDWHLRSLRYISGS